MTDHVGLARFHVGQSKMVSHAMGNAFVDPRSKAVHRRSKSVEVSDLKDLVGNSDIDRSWINVNNHKFWAADDVVRNNKGKSSNPKDDKLTGDGQQRPTKDAGEKRESSLPMIKYYMDR